ncbi:MAG: tetratricopeptide repeat protein [Gemmataceae bacterium]
MPILVVMSPLAILLLFTTETPPQTPGEASPEQLFRQAVARQRAGEKARASYLAAIAAYRSYRDQGVRNPHLDRTIGNAYLLMGDLPEAIAWYRRGLKLAPWDATLHEALTLARERVARPPGRTFGLPPDVLPSPAPWLFLGATFCWMAACLLFTHWYVQRGGWPWGGIVLTTLAFSLALAWALQPAEPAIIAVIRRDEVYLRRGDGVGFAPRYPTPLPAGTEAVALARRGEWWLIQLSGGERGWVADTDLLLLLEE